MTHTSVQEPGGPRPVTGRDRSQTGRRGEDLAAAYLTDLGWTVLERNWRPQGLAGLRGELDIVASEPSACAGRPVLVAVEVKTRSSAVAGTPAEAVTPAKRRRLARLAAAWLAEHGGSGRRLRLDVISILLRDPLPAQLRHHRGVWS
nr:YraN family protein [Actinomyces sp.]